MFKNNIWITPASCERIRNVPFSLVFKSILRSISLSAPSRHSLYTRYTYTRGGVILRKESAPLTLFDYHDLLFIAHHGDPQWGGTRGRAILFSFNIRSYRYRRASLYYGYRASGNNELSSLPLPLAGAPRNVLFPITAVPTPSIEQTSCYFRLISIRFRTNILFDCHTHALIFQSDITDDDGASAR